jgi:hypothetical protein
MFENFPIFQNILSAASTGSQGIGTLPMGVKHEVTEKNAEKSSKVLDKIAKEANMSVQTKF